MRITRAQLRQLVLDEARSLHEDAGWQGFLDSIAALREACSEAIAAGSATGVSRRLLDRLEKIDGDLYELQAELE